MLKLKCLFTLLAIIALAACNKDTTITPAFLKNGGDPVSGNNYPATYSVYSTAYNLGNGDGYSNRQVIDAVREATGRKFEVARRAAGDPARLVADSGRIRRELGCQRGFSSEPRANGHHAGAGRRHRERADPDYSGYRPARRRVRNTSPKRKQGKALRISRLHSG